MSPVRAKADEQAWTELKITHAAELAEGVELGKRFDQEAVFRRGHDEAPIVTALTAQYFTQLRLREGRLPQLPVRGFAVTTIAAHRRALRKLMEIPEKYRNLPIDEALVMYFTDEAVAKNWQPTTTTVKMATTHGALRILPVYARGAGAMMLKESVLWMQAMKGAARAAKEHRVNQPLAATWDEVKKAIQLEGNKKVRMALLLTWLTCGRGGDVLLLQPRDVETRGDRLDVAFCKGKTVKTRGSYVVFTQAPPEEFAAEWEEHCKEAQGGKYLFHGVKGAQIKDALRRVNKKLEQRSLRRGAIQTLAASGIADEKLLHYSGHTNVTMLRRYLNFGKVSGEGGALAEAAAPLLMDH